MSAIRWSFQRTVESLAPFTVSVIVPERWADVAASALCAAAYALCGDPPPSVTPPTAIASAAAVATPKERPISRRRGAGAATGPLGRVAWM